MTSFLSDILLQFPNWNDLNRRAANLSQSSEEGYPNQLGSVTCLYPVQLGSFKQIKKAGFNLGLLGSLPRQQNPYSWVHWVFRTQLTQVNWALKPSSSSLVGFMKTLKASFQLGLLGFLLCKATTPAESWVHQVLKPGLTPAQLGSLKLIKSQLFSQKTRWQTCHFKKVYIIINIRKNFAQRRNLPVKSYDKLATKPLPNSKVLESSSFF